jgi:hypothetical protein
MNTLALKLGRTIALLASDKEGEIVAAAHAAKRLLAAGGRDFNDLGSFIESNFFKPADDDWLAIATWLAARFDTLSLKEAGFVANMNRMGRMGKRPSPAQEQWLRDLFERENWRAA